MNNPVIPMPSMLIIPLTTNRIFHILSGTTGQLYPIPDFEMLVSSHRTLLDVRFASFWNLYSVPPLVFFVVPVGVNDSHLIVWEIDRAEDLVPKLALLTVSIEVFRMGFKKQRTK